MALANLLSSECSDFSSDYRQPLAFGCGSGQNGLESESTPGESLSFSVKNPLVAGDEDGVERKIEFLHGTTTLAFKVS